MDDVIADIYANMGQHDVIVVGGDHGMTDVFVENKSIRNDKTLDYYHIVFLTIVIAKDFLNHINEYFSCHDEMWYLFK